MLDDVAGPVDLLLRRKGAECKKFCLRCRVPLSGEDTNFHPFLGVDGEICSVGQGLQAMLTSKQSTAFFTLSST